MVETATRDHLMHLHACPTPESTSPLPKPLLTGICPTVLKIYPRRRHQKPSARALQGPTSPSATDLAPASPSYPDLGYPPAPAPAPAGTHGRTQPKQKHQL